MTPMRQILVFLACLAAATTLFVKSAPVQARSFGDLQVVQAIDALDRDQPKQALRLLLPLLHPSRPQTKVPEQHTLRFLAARAALGLERYDAVLFYTENLTDGLPEIADFVLAMRAQAWAAQQQWALALQAWQQLRNDFPRSPLRGQAAYGLGHAMFGQARWDDARRAYEFALRHYPRDPHAPDARFNVAQMAESDDAWSTAAREYRRLRSNPRAPKDLVAAANERLTQLRLQGLPTSSGNLRHRLNTIDRLILQGELSFAGDELDVMATDPRFVEHQDALEYRYARIAYRQQEYGTAIQKFSQLAANADGHEKIDYEKWLSRTYSTAGDIEAAIQVQKNIARRNRRNSKGREALYKAAWLSYNGGFHSASVELFEQFIRRFPRDRAVDEALWFMGWNSYRAGKIAQAAKVFARLRRQFPRSSLTPRAAYWEARTLAQMNQPAAAQASYQAVLQLAPNSYYGALAGQRLAQMAKQQRPFFKQNPLVASLVTDPQLTHPAAKPRTTAAPYNGRPTGADNAKPTPSLGSQQPQLPWEDDVFLWHSPAGKRITTLVRLGMPEAAAQAVPQLPHRDGVNATERLYARARLLHGLGAFKDAYLTTTKYFERTLEAKPDRDTKRFFHLAYPGAYLDIIQPFAAEYDVSPLIVLSVMRQESMFDPTARSPANAQGLMQIIPQTGRRIAQSLRDSNYEETQLHNVTRNIRFGTWYLAALVRKFHGNLALAVASYNAGPNAVQRWLKIRHSVHMDEFVEDIPYRETRHYVKRVVANLAVYTQLYRAAPPNLMAYVTNQYLDNVTF